MSSDDDMWSEFGPWEQEDFADLPGAFLDWLQSGVEGPGAVSSIAKRRKVLRISWAYLLFPFPII